MNPGTILEPIFTNFILKIESLKEIFRIIKPKYGITKLNSILSDSKIDSIFIDKQTFHQDDLDIITSIKLKQSGLLFRMFSLYTDWIEDELLHYAYGYQVDILSEELYNELYEDLLDIEKKYNNKVSFLIDKYFAMERRNDKNTETVDESLSRSAAENVDKESITEEYNKYLLNSRVPSRINDIFSAIMTVLDKIQPDRIALCIQMGDLNYEALKTLIRNYNTYNINAKLKKINYENCDECCIRYTIDHEKGEIFCKSCGLLSKISGDMYDSTFSLSTDGKSKNSMYVSSGHCEFWFKRIFALEPTDMKDEIISSVKNWLVKNNYSITCEYIRKALQKLKLPTYNTHVSLIRKLLTGKVPEPPSHKIKIQIFNDFNLAVAIYSEIYQDNNIKYYPYFIWKIIEMIYWHRPKRRYEIFECIHLQNLDTLKKNDKIWKRICARVPRFKFRYTDRNEQYIYME